MLTVVDVCQGRNETLLLPSPTKKVIIPPMNLLQTWTSAIRVQSRLRLWLWLCSWLGNFASGGLAGYWVTLSATICKQLQQQQYREPVNILCIQAAMRMLLDLLIRSIHHSLILKNPSQQIWHLIFQSVNQCTLLIK